MSATMHDSTLVLRLADSVFRVGKAGDGMGSIRDYLSIPGALEQDPEKMWGRFLHWRRPELQSGPRRAAGFGENPPDDPIRL